MNYKNSLESYFNLLGMFSGYTNHVLFIFDKLLLISIILLNMMYYLQDVLYSFDYFFTYF